MANGDRFVDDALRKVAIGMVQNGDQATMQEKLNILLAFSLDTNEHVLRNTARISRLEGLFIFTPWFKRIFAGAVGLLGTFMLWVLVVHWEAFGGFLEGVLP